MLVLCSTKACGVYNSLVHEITQLIINLIINGDPKQISDSLGKDIITHFLQLLEKTDTKFYLICDIFQAMNKLIQQNRALKDHYYDSHGEEIIERWEEDEKTQEAKNEFEKSLAASNWNQDDPLFQQLYDLY